MMECPQEPDECCNSGCNPCIFDVYERQLQKYKQNQSKSSLKKKNLLRELKYVKFKLIHVIRHGPHVNIYVFESEVECTSEEEVSHEPGQHLLIKSQSKYDKSDFTRAYTPIPWEDLSSNQFAMLIKLYPSGDMSNYIERLNIGDVTDWRGPYGDYEIDYTQKCLLVIGQGTGIAPLYAIIKKVCENEDCEMRMKLVYCCRDFDQIYLRNELYKLLDYWNFTYELFLSAESNEETVGALKKYKEVVHSGRLGESDLKMFLGEEDWSQVLICGSNLFAKAIEDVVKGNSSVPVHSF